jgi:hypothetical protein
MAGIKVYTVCDGDTIERVALATTGSATNWRLLVSFNRLRAPYFSNDPRDRVGVILAQGTLPAAVAAGDQALPLAVTAALGPTPSLIENGGTLLLFTTDSAGSPIADSCPILSYNAVTALLSLAAPVPRGYPAGAAWFLTGYEQPLRVLATGDALLIPDGPDVAIRPTDQLTDFLGTDVFLADDGHLLLSVAQEAVGYATLFANPAPATNLLIAAGLGLIATDGTRFVTTEATILPGASSGASQVDVPVRSLLSGGAATIAAHLLTTIDPASTAPLVATTITAVDNAQPLVGLDGTGDLLTTTGIDNLRQAIVHRLATRKGELPYFPTYGNDAWGALGMRNRFVEQALVEAAVIQCAADDDRVAAVRGGTISRTADTLALSIEVLPRSLGYTLTLHDLQISLLQQNPAT